ncbi:hypothetical protein Tco_0080436 [Tanacetum coccineum]
MHTDISSIKEMLTEMFHAFKTKHEHQDLEPIPITVVRPTTKSAPEVEHIGSSSSRPKLTDTVIDITPPEKQSDDPLQTTPKDNRGKGIARDTDESLSKLIELNKPVLIKVVEEVASDTGVDPSALRSKKGGQEFLKQQDVELKVHQREHVAKVKKSNELRKKRYNMYVWNTTNRLKSEKITNIHIHPNTKPVAITVYRNNDQINFDVHNRFRFGDFGITQWDELSVIIPKKKNKVVGELMESLSKKYDRLEVIHVKLGISPTSPSPEQTHSLSLGRKIKELELEPEIPIAGLECNRSLPEGIPFVNNRVIENPEHGIFFTDALDENAFKRVSDIHKVEVETLFGYLVMAGNVNIHENQRFCVLLRQMIDAHPDREKLKSKKVKMEAIGYSFK